jgi:iron complex transport system substrate-binding protein
MGPRVYPRGSILGEEMKRNLAILAMLALVLIPRSSSSVGEQVVKDAAARDVQVPATVERIICSGAGALRLLTYLHAQHMVIAVDDMEKRRSRFDARPYAFANPRFKDYPLFGEFRGHDNPERILALEPPPQVILKTFASMGYNPVELQDKTGIPVIILEYGDLGKGRHFFYEALRIMGIVVGREERSRKVIHFFESCIRDLQNRTGKISEDRRKTCYVGGIAFKGPHGFQSTEPGYPPFSFVRARNVAYMEVVGGKVLRQSNVAKEKIIEWDPEVLFLDLSTLQMGKDAGGLHELKTDPAYRSLAAVRKGEVYGLLPYNWYAQNFGSILANAYFIGKLLYPDRFRDIDPAKKADEIYYFLVGQPVFGEMKRSFQGLPFERIPLN